MKTRLKGSAATVALIGALQLVSPQVAWAQEATQSPQAETETSGLDEIVVTAQKRSQKLTDVGATIVAASALQLQKAGVTDVSQLAAVVPGFSASVHTSGYPVFSIRGVSFNSLQASAPPAVSVYVDEAGLPYSVMTGALLLDVERVEVLKGPQGTLFGQNATGGSINVIAAKPTDYFAAGVQTEINSFGQASLNGFISGPLSSTLRARVAVSTTQGGAWQRSYHIGDRTNGDQNKAAGRILLDWTPTDRLKISLNVNAFFDRGEKAQAQVTKVAPAIPAATPPEVLTYALPTNNRDADIDPGLDTHADDSGYQSILRGDYDITDDLVLTSLTNFVKTDVFSPINADGTAVPSIVNKYSASLKSFSQELRLTGKVPSANLNYILGVNYQRDTVVDNQTNVYPGYSGFPYGTQVRVNYRAVNRSVGVFGNADYEIVPRLTLTAGVRYTDTKQAVTGCTYDGGNGFAAGVSAFLASFIPGAVPGAASAYVPGGCITVNNVGPASQLGLPIVADLTQKQSNVSWRAGLNFKPTDDSLVYGLVSRGYKAGVINEQINLLYSQIATPVSQEKLTSYEIGAKAGLFDRKLQLSVAGFYYDYQDKQFFTYVPTPPFATFATLVNIPKSTVKGIDFDFTARPFESLTMRGAITYLKTEIKQYSGFLASGAPAVFDGKEFNFAPPLSGTFDAEYRAPVSGSLNAYIGGNVTYNSRAYGDLGETVNSRLDPYAIFDARIGVESDNGWRAGLWVRNLADKHYMVSAGLGGGDTEVGWSGRPRTFGVTVGANF